MIADVFIEWLDALGDYALLIIPLVAFLEACLGIGLFVSGAILLSLCTLLYSQGGALLQQMLPLAFIGAFAADNMGYAIGRWMGPKFHNTKVARNNAAGIARAEKLVLNHGELAIILGRLIPAVRSVVPLLTGISGLPYARYLRYDLIACAIWITGLGLLVTGIGRLLE